MAETTTPVRTTPTPSPLYDPDTVREPIRWCPQQKRRGGWELT